MTRRTRRLLFIVSAGIFLIVSGPLLFYTFGYRFSFSDFTFRETGGVFVHANPPGARVTIEPFQKTTSFITGNAFIQNLQPGTHTVTVSRSQFHPWQKTVPVQARMVTELYPLLIPETLPSHFLATTTAPTLHASPHALYIVLSEGVYNVRTNTLLPYANRISRVRAADISPETKFFWHANEESALLEMENDWLLLTRSETNTILLESLWRTSSLRNAVPTKPRLIKKDPRENNTYIILDGSNLLKWNTRTGTLHPLLQSIAGIGVYPSELFLLDTQSEGLYRTDINGKEAMRISTTTFSGVTNAFITKHGSSLVLHTNEGVWLSREGAYFRRIAGPMPHTQLVVTNSYLIWWTDTSITIHWTIPEEDFPAYQSQRQELLYSSPGANIRAVYPYPSEQYLIVQDNADVFSLEIDDHGGSRVTQPIYTGTDPRIYVPHENPFLYVLDQGTVFYFELP